MLIRETIRTETIFIRQYKTVLATCIIPKSQLLVALYMNKEHVRFYIKVHTALNIPPLVIYKELHTVFDDQAPLLRTVQRWLKTFLEGREEVEDDPYLIVDEIEEQTGLSHDTIPQIISNHLQLRKTTTRYVSKHLTNSQKAERVRTCHRTYRNLDKVSGDPLPTVVRCNRFAPRTLLFIFFK